MEKDYLQKRSDPDAGSHVKIVDPGYNMPSATEWVEDLKAKWYRGISISGNAKVYKRPGWYIVNSLTRDSDGLIMYLIRNDDLRLDLIISQPGIKIDRTMFKDDDFLI